MEPATVIAWHRRGLRVFWTWKSRHRTGRPSVPTETRDLIRIMSQAYPLWGAPRLHGELLKVGIDVCQATNRDDWRLAADEDTPQEYVTTLCYNCSYICWRLNGHGGHP